MACRLRWSCARATRARRAGGPRGRWRGAAAGCRRAGWRWRDGVPGEVALRSGDGVEGIGRAALDMALAGGGLLALGLPEALPWRFGYSAERIVRASSIPVLQLRSARCEHVVPLEDEPARVADGASAERSTMGDLVGAAVERNDGAYAGALAGGRL